MRKDGGGHHSQNYDTCIALCALWLHKWDRVDSMPIGFLVSVNGLQPCRSSDDAQ
jgi:hypothetical protein